PAGWVHPLAIQALAEIGIDITGQTSKGAAAFLEETFDIVVTLCDSAAQDCPHWPNARRIEHWSIEDPSWGIDDPVTRPHRFAETRDEIGRRIEELAGRLS
ncbi:MAG TPA: arsenate reductase ArsC, partial [Thermoanaerobaculia bacterium]|nr:arsenate reductase ArsC [Thermoanaerobaculia bacterium]